MSGVNISREKVCLCSVPTDAAKTDLHVCAAAPMVRRVSMDLLLREHSKSFR